MRTLLFTLASIATVTMVDPGRAQYVYPSAPGPMVVPTQPRYAPTIGGAAPGYKWRDERANEDWRNNTWREHRENEDWRNRDWRTQRANEDWRERKDNAKELTPNNAVDRGYVECGVGPVGSSTPCQGYTKDKTQNNYTGNKTDDAYGNDKPRKREVDKYVGECSVRLCR